jgi:hypothetical protein
VPSILFKFILQILEVILYEPEKPARIVAGTTSDTCDLSGNFLKTNLSGIAFRDFHKHWMVPPGTLQ